MIFARLYQHNPEIRSHIAGQVHAKITSRDDGSLLCKIDRLDML